MARAAEVVLQLRAENAQYLAKLRQSEAQFSRSLGNIQRVAGATGAFLRTTIAGLLAGVSLAGLQKFSESATRIDNALKVAGLSGQELDRVYGKLRDSAVKNAAPLEALVTLYGRAALVQKELGVSTDDLTTFSDKVAVALRVSGKSAQESSGALLQLSQALGAGTVRAEEFSSIQEGAPTILQAAAAGIKEAGGSVSKLRQIMLDGELSSRALFDGFIAGSSTLEERAAAMDLTIGQAFENLNTALVDSAREFNTSTGASKNFAEGINNLATAIADFDVSGFIDKISEAGGALDTFLGELGNADIFKRLNESLGLTDEAGNIITIDGKEAQAEVERTERLLQILQKKVEEQTALGMDVTEALAQISVVEQRLAALRGQAASIPQVVPRGGLIERPPTPTGAGFIGSPELPSNRPEGAVPQISIKDEKYKPTGGAGKGGRKSAKERADEYERLAARIADATAAQVAETEAQRQLNPLVEDYGYALEKARTTQDLLNAAKEAGIEITPKLRGEIDALAEQFATASVEAAKLAEEQDRARENAEKWLGVGQDVTKGFIDDLIRGESAAGAFANAIAKIGDALINDVLENIFKIRDAGSGGGIFDFLGKIFGAIFGGGGGKDPWAGLRLAEGGTVRGPGGPRGDKIPAMLSDGEHVTRASMAKKHGALLAAINSDRLPALADGGFITPTMPAMPRTIAAGASRSSSTATFNMHVSVDGNGDKELMARMQKGVEVQMQQAFQTFEREVMPRKVNQIVRDPHAVG